MHLPICHEEPDISEVADFLAKWPLSRVRTMPLADYTRVRLPGTEDTFRDSFCYGLEKETPNGIGSGNALKFEVYAYRNKPRVRKSKHDDRYCWHERLGSSAEEAYANIREKIVKVIEFAQAGNYLAIDEVPLVRTLKWKIAFLYQNRANPGIIGCAAEDYIRDYFEKKNLPGADTLPVSQLHAIALEQAAGARSLNEVGHKIWEEMAEEEEPEVAEEESEEDDDEGEAERAFWIYGAGLGPRSGGITDIHTILRTGEIRINLDISSDLSAISSEKEVGKIDVLRILLNGDENAVKQALNNTYNFHHMGIPNGAVLTYVHDETKQAIVTGPRDITFEGNPTSISALTAKLAETSSYPSVMRAWTYAGKKLKEYQRATTKQPPKISALMAWHFAKSMKPGDVVLARKAGTVEYIAGIITSDYAYDPSRSDYRHSRKVRWLNSDPMDVGKELGRLSKKLITRAVSSDGTPWSEAIGIAKILGVKLDELPAIDFQPIAPAIRHSMNKPTNVILYGPPGTGKTFHTKEHAVTLCNGKATPATLKEDFAKLVADKRVAFVTFHQSYDYSDFIIGFKPVPSASGMSFEVRKGVLMRLAEEAEKNPQLPYLLIIDEINRGNISKIFGELITLIEADKRRDGDFPLEVTLPCAFKGADGKETCQFSLPSNVHLLGTMNTADRSIALLDTALRRRFKFVRKEPKPDLLHADLDGVKLPKLLTKLNDILVEAFSPDHQIGHAWLPMKFDAKATAKDLVDAFNDKILPLLDEWYYDNADAKKELIAQLTEDGKVTLVALKKFSDS